MITLVLGGVRSGKSQVAETVAARAAAVTGDLLTYIATGTAEPGDAAALARTEAHRARRPAWWRTVEEPHALAKMLLITDGIVLVDSLGTWLAHDVDGANFDDVIAAIIERPGDTVLVSEEVGLGVHPPTEVGRRFADRLGELNRRVAEVADDVVLVAAGRALTLPAPEMAGVSTATAAIATGPVEGGDASPGATGVLAGLRAALAFLTISGGARVAGRTAADWFPVAGALIGGGLGLLWWAMRAAAPALVAAAFVVTADAVATGGLHLDGLADSADALLPPVERRRRLAILRDPHVGAFGVTALVLVLGLRVAALAAFGSGRPLLLAALWCGSRTAMAVTMRVVPYARREGLAFAFMGGPVVAVAVTGGALTLALAAGGGAVAVVAVVASWTMTAATQWLAVRRLGGFTGDTLGAAAVLGETVGLSVAAVLV